MFDKHLIINNGKEKNLYLYINNYYEFSSELNSEKQIKNNLFDMINKYIKLKKIKFNGNKVYLVLNGVVMGYIYTKDLGLSSPNDIIQYDYINDLVELFDYNVETIYELIDK